MDEEIANDTVSLLRGEFAEYAGGITSDPRVDYVQGDGRTFLARSDEEYDLVERPRKRQEAECRRTA